jgi:hypothetical protein
MSDSSSQEPAGDSSFFQYNVTSQLDMLIFLVALIGAGVTLRSLVGAFVGITCLGIAVITLFRLYQREYR